MSSRAQVRRQEGGIEELAWASAPALHGHVTPPLPCTKEVMIILPSAEGLVTVSYPPGLVPKKPRVLEGCPPQRSSRCLARCPAKKASDTDTAGWVGCMNRWGDRTKVTTRGHQIWLEIFYDPCCCSVAQSCLTLCDPAWTAARQASLPFTISRSLPKLTCPLSQ